MEKETIWRITEDDFRGIIEDNFPNLPKRVIEELIERAHEKFSIDDWSEYVAIFITCWLEELADRR